LLSCGPKRGGSSFSEEKTNNEINAKVEVTAYLFDAKLRRDGKPTSLRLEIYQTDSVIGLYGRAYLGKTGLKGTLTRDSLALYFPTTDEYIAERTKNLLTSLPCEINTKSFDLFALFTTFPDSLSLDSLITIESDYSDSKRAHFHLSTPECNWEIELTYDLKQKGWRLREFEYQNGKRTSLSATRRKYRYRAKTGRSRLNLTIPETATRISP